MAGFLRDVVSHADGRRPGALALALALALGLAACAANTPPRASPRGVARALVDGRAIVVEYGRPWRRDRTIFGELVPYGRVWRTGADEATVLQTDLPLRFEDHLLEPGRYTLWTVPGRQRWTIILNAQTGQWGTDYHAAHDLFRMEVPVRRTRRMIDQFTIRVRVRRARGTLTLLWERTRVTVPFGVVRPAAAHAGRNLR
ncbi:MAG: DUF2911 domain-containing protein [Acidobacteriota bacterium]|nr:DUF2911 domain-containing protein [Acidobacteriota bacterium]